MDVVQWCNFLSCQSVWLATAIWLDKSGQINKFSNNVIILSVVLCEKRWLWAFWLHIAKELKQPSKWGKPGSSCPNYWSVHFTDFCEINRIIWALRFRDYEILLRNESRFIWLRFKSSSTLALICPPWPAKYAKLGEFWKWTTSAKQKAAQLIYLLCHGL